MRILRWRRQQQPHVGGRDAATSNHPIAKVASVACGGGQFHLGRAVVVRTDDDGPAHEPGYSRDVFTASADREGFLLLELWIASAHRVVVRLLVLRHTGADSLTERRVPALPRAVVPH